MGEIGKRIRGSIYAHRSALAFLEDAHADKVALAERILGDVGDWNVVKLERGEIVGLMTYEPFERVAFPALIVSRRIDLSTRQATIRDFSKSGNPPILHRKELLGDPGHPCMEQWLEMTRILEAAGAFRDAHLIGRRNQWSVRLRECGFAIKGPCLVSTPR